MKFLDMPKVVPGRARAPHQRQVLGPALNGRRTSGPTQFVAGGVNRSLTALYHHLSDLTCTRVSALPHRGMTRLQITSPTATTFSSAILSTSTTMSPACRLGLTDDEAHRTGLIGRDATIVHGRGPRRRGSFGTAAFKEVRKTCPLTRCPTLRTYFPRLGSDGCGGQLDKRPSLSPLRGHCCVISRVKREAVWNETGRPWGRGDLE